MGPMVADAPLEPGSETARQRPARGRLLRDLERPSQVFAHLTPNWFAAVMGTGIVAVAATSLPARVPGLRAAAVVVWALAALLLLALVGATATHWVRHPITARGHVHHPVMGHFYGAPPMAMLTVGTGALLVGRDVLGERLAVDVDWVLWFAGTLSGLASAVVVPYLMLAHRRLRLDGAFGGWLMSVVPPMVSASAGALLIPHTAAGAARSALLIACYVMFALAVLASVPIILLVCRRLRRHGAGEARMVPTVWILLGPLGQSVTAVNLLGSVADEVLPPSDAAALRSFALGYGLPVLSVALVLAAYAAAVTARTVREELPFSLTWWSFTFPVGTCVTGASGLALHTGWGTLRILAIVSYVGLVLAWILVAGRTARGMAAGQLFLAPQATPSSA